MARRSLAHNFQAVWHGAAIMALCWPATPSEVKFAADCLLEERVRSELVSENRKFPASREFTGNFIESGLGGASTAAKKGAKPEAYGSIPYASEQGIKSGLAGN